MSEYSILYFTRYQVDLSIWQRVNLQVIEVFILSYLSFFNTDRLTLRRIFGTHSAHQVIDLIGIIQSHLNFRDTSPCGWGNLKFELEQLCLSSKLANLAIEAYRYTPLHESLTEIIKPILKECKAILEEILITLESYREGLLDTVIRYLWRLPWYHAHLDDVISYQRKLHLYCNRLGVILMATRS